MNIKCYKTKYIIRFTYIIGIELCISNFSSILLVGVVEIEAIEMGDFWWKTRCKVRSLHD